MKNKAPSSCFTPSWAAPMRASPGLCANHHITALLNGNTGQWERLDPPTQLVVLVTLLCLL